MAAGAAASQFGTTWTAVLFGWDPATAKDVWLAVPINLISGLVLSGLLGFYLAKGLARTGLSVLPPARPDPFRRATD